MTRRQGKPPPTVAEGVIAGDAFDLIQRVGDSSVDLILTSPPYWGLRSYGLEHNEDVLDRWTDAGCSATREPPYDWYRTNGGQLGREPYPNWYTAHLVEFFGRARRVLKAEGSVWVNLGDTYFARWSSLRDNGRQGIDDERRRRRTPAGGYLHDKQLLMVPARFAIAMQDDGWILRNDLIWAKPNPIPRPEADRLRLSHEHWFHFVRRTPGGRPAYYYDLSQAEEGARDVVQCSTASGSNGHSATFPSEIVQHRIRSSTPVGGVVLDPFCGVGTTIVEALRTNRLGIGFELSSQHAQTAKSAVRAVERERKAPQAARPVPNARASRR